MSGHAHMYNTSLAQWKDGELHGQREEARSQSRRRFRDMFCGKMTVERGGTFLFIRVPFPPNLPLNDGPSVYSEAGELPAAELLLL